MVSWALLSSAASPRSRSDLATCFAVVVFPHHLGPCTRTAPFPKSLRFNSSSAIRRYHIFQYRQQLFRNFRKDYSATSRCFVPQLFVIALLVLSRLNCFIMVCQSGRIGRCSQLNRSRSCCCSRLSCLQSRSCTRSSGF